jgi:hypothetical protein
MKAKARWPQTVRDIYRVIRKLLQCFSNDINDDNNDCKSGCYEFCVVGN